MTILEIKDLCQSYNGSAPVLRDMSLAVEHGEFVGVIGLSGSGKSTLLRCINRLVEARSGEIWVPRGLLTGELNGAPIDVLRLDAADLRRLRRKIGMIFQQFNLAKRLSVIENVLSGGLGYKPSLRSTLRIFAREERHHALANLKRVGLKLSRVVLDILKRICREDGITTLMSLHTLELTREYVDRVIGLRRGQIVFDGPTVDLTDPVVDAIYHHQA